MTAKRVRLRYRAFRRREDMGAPKPRAASLSAKASRDIERIGFDGAGWRDIYHGLMTVSPPMLLGAIALTYLGANVVFALLYMILGSGIYGARPGVFSDAFFFSIETMSTIGYGQLTPEGLASNLIMTAETVFGLLLTALSTGVLFARLSRPTARVMFSKVAIISTYGGAPMLMLRVANRRRNQVMEATMTLAALRDEDTPEGHQMRRFFDMRLVRSRTPVFGLTWTVMHPLDGDSPLHGLSPEDFIQQKIDIVCTFSGIDDTYSQTVHDRYAYTAADLRWNARFADIFSDRPEGGRVIDYTQFHDTIDLET